MAGEQNDPDAREARWAARTIIGMCSEDVPFDGPTMQAVAAIVLAQRRAAAEAARTEERRLWEGELLAMQVAAVDAGDLRADDTLKSLAQRVIRAGAPR